MVRFCGVSITRTGWLACGSRSPPAPATAGSVIRTNPRTSKVSADVGIGVSSTVGMAPNTLGSTATSEVVIAGTTMSPWLGKKLVSAKVPARKPGRLSTPGVSMNTSVLPSRLRFVSPGAGGVATNSSR